jgi:2-polyprenyl-6-methoxyphenol hydroxylase-like FAD-dependent oxidoreductase
MRRMWCIRGGQGVNLGLRDVTALRDSIRDAHRGVPITPRRSASRDGRATRKSDNAASAHAFSALNRIFSNDDMLATLLRGPMLGMAGACRHWRARCGDTRRGVAPVVISARWPRRR